MTHGGLLLLCLALGLVGCVPQAEPLGVSHSAVVAGSATPDSIGFPLGRLERHAMLAARFGGNQGCSGTLVGDRVVVSAAHCVVTNQEAWIHGAAPVITDPAKFTFTAGDDIDAPICVLPVASIHIHPDVDPAGYTLLHDISIEILADSALDKCPGVVPVQANLEALDGNLPGTSLLQGGFGSSAHDYHFSKKLQWSLLQVSELLPDSISLTDQGKGSPSYGDSGSGLLHRFSDGSVRTVGIDSSMTSDYMFYTFARVDDQAAFIQETLAKQIGPDPICGAITDKGRCVDDAVVTCSKEGFRSVDCRADGKQCVVDAQGAAACTCLDCAEAASPASGCTMGSGPMHGSAGVWLLSWVVVACLLRRRRLRCSMPQGTIGHSVPR